MALADRGIRFIWRRLGPSVAGFLDFVYPPKCVVCGVIGSSGVCPNCVARFVRVRPPVCDVCGTSLRGRGANCRVCADAPSRHYVSMRAAGVFEGRLRFAILALKYDRKSAVADALGDFLYGALMARPVASPPPDVVVPVPLSWARERARGFNQSWLVGRRVADLAGIDAFERAIIRTRHTRPQVRLRPDQRVRNVQGIFRVRNAPAVAGRTILLVDDVVTTGSTVNECARVLMDSGARAVHVICVARG